MQSNLISIHPLSIVGTGLETLLFDYKRLLKGDANTVLDNSRKSDLLNKVLLLLSVRR
jgi:hypothetical protein